MIGEHTFYDLNLLTLLRSVFWPNMWSVMENVPCVFQEHVFAALGWSDLYVSVMSTWSIVLFKSSVSLLIFSLVPSMSKPGPLKSPMLFLSSLLLTFASFFLEI